MNTLELLANLKLSISNAKYCNATPEYRVMAMAKLKYSQFKGPYCVACGHSGDDFNPLDVDHIKTRGSGGKNVNWNCWTLCRRNHTEKGQIGLIKFAQRWPRAKEWLILHGWEIDEYTGKWTHA